MMDIAGGSSKAIRSQFYPFGFVFCGRKRLFWRTQNRRAIPPFFGSRPKKVIDHLRWLLGPLLGKANKINQTGLGNPFGA